MQRIVEVATNTPQTEDAKRFLRMVPADGTLPAIPAEEIESTLKADPAYVPALMLRAAEEEKRGDRNAAVTSYTEVLRLYPTFAPAQKRLASVYTDTPENRDKAYSLAVEARKTLQDDVELIRTLGILSYQRGEFSYAVQLLETGAKAGPLNAKELFYLGMARVKAKSPAASAREALRSAVDAGLAEPQATEAKRALAELEAQK